MTDHKFAVIKAGFLYCSRQYKEAAAQYKQCIDEMTGEMCNKPAEDLDALTYIEQLQYMYCLCLLELDKTEDTIVLYKQLNKQLHGLKLIYGDNFPAIYYVIARLFINMYKFALAKTEIRKGISFLHTQKPFRAYCIPETNIVLAETTRIGLASKLHTLEAKCSLLNKPDAICCLKLECNLITQMPLSLRSSEFETDYKAIFIRDPAFEGMVTTICSNSLPCILQFHSICWQYLKKRYGKTEDKDMLNVTCFTKRCTISNSVNNIITQISIIGADGKIENSFISMHKGIKSNDTKTKKDPASCESVKEAHELKRKKRNKDYAEKLDRVSDAKQMVIIHENILQTETDQECKLSIHDDNANERRLSDTKIICEYTNSSGTQKVILSDSTQEITKDASGTSHESADYRLFTEKELSEIYEYADAFYSIEESISDDAKEEDFTQMIDSALTTLNDAAKEISSVKESDIFANLCDANSNMIQSFQQEDSSMYFSDFDTSPRKSLDLSAESKNSTPKNQNSNKSSPFKHSVNDAPSRIEVIDECVEERTTDFLKHDCENAKSSESGKTCDQAGNEEQKENSIAITDSAASSKDSVTKKILFKDSDEIDGNLCSKYKSVNEGDSALQSILVDTTDQLKKSQCIIAEQKITIQQLNIKIEQLTSKIADQKNLIEEDPILEEQILGNSLQKFRTLITDTARENKRELQKIFDIMVEHEKKKHKKEIDEIVHEYTLKDIELQKELDTNEEKLIYITEQLKSMSENFSNFKKDALKKRLQDQYMKTELSILRIMNFYEISFDIVKSLKDILESTIGANVTEHELVNWESNIIYLRQELNQYEKIYSEELVKLECEDYVAACDDIPWIPFKTPDPPNKPLSTYVKNLFITFHDQLTERLYEYAMLQDRPQNETTSCVLTDNECMQIATVSDNYASTAHGTMDEKKMDIDNVNKDVEKIKDLNFQEDVELLYLDSSVDSESDEELTYKSQSTDEENDNSAIGLAVFMHNAAIVEKQCEKLEETDTEHDKEQAVNTLISTSQDEITLDNNKKTTFVDCEKQIDEGLTTSEVNLASNKDVTLDEVDKDVNKEVITSELNETSNKGVIITELSDDSDSLKRFFSKTKESSIEINSEKQTNEGMTTRETYLFSDEATLSKADEDSNKRVMTSESSDHSDDKKQVSSPEKMSSNTVIDCEKQTNEEVTTNELNQVDDKELILTSDEKTISSKTSNDSIDKLKTVWSQTNIDEIMSSELDEYDIIAEKMVNELISDDKENFPTKSNTITDSKTQTDEEVTTSENSTSNDENVTTNESDEYDLSGKIICSSTVIHDENPFVSGLNRCIHIVDTILSRLKRLNKEFLSSESNITTDCKTQHDKQASTSEVNRVSDKKLTLSTASGVSNKKIFGNQSSNYIKFGNFLDIDIIEEVTSNEKNEHIRTELISEFSSDSNNENIPSTSYLNTSYKSWNKVMPKLVDSSTNTYFEMRQPSTSDYELAAANSKRVDNMFTFINNKLHGNKPDDVTRLHAAYIDKEMNVINNVMTEMSQKYPHFACMDVFNVLVDLKDKGMALSKVSRSYIIKELCYILTNYYKQHHYIFRPPILIPTNIEKDNSSTSSSSRTTSSSTSQLSSSLDNLEENNTSMSSRATYI